MSGNMKKLFASYYGWKCKNKFDTNCVNQSAQLSEVDKCGIKLICSFNFNNEISGIALNGAKALYGATVYVESMPTAKLNTYTPAGSAVGMAGVAVVSDS